MRVTVAWIWRETEFFPECSGDGGAGVHRHVASQGAGTLKQRDGQLTSDTKASKRGSNIEASHAQCARCQPVEKREGSDFIPARGCVMEYLRLGDGTIEQS